MNNNYLMHYGVKGQQWGKRRYQNKDGSYKSGSEGRYYQVKDDGAPHKSDDGWTATLIPGGKGVIHNPNGQTRYYYHGGGTGYKKTGGAYQYNVVTGRTGYNNNYLKLGSETSGKLNPDGTIKSQSTSLKSFGSGTGDHIAASMRQKTTQEQIISAIRKYSTNTISSISTVAQSTVSKAKSFISNLFKKK